MILRTVHFDYFKSLVNAKLDITDNCTGIVGINESGKSNILQAIRILNGDEHLKKVHVPKILKGNNPKIRYEFELREKQLVQIRESISSWLQTNALTKFSIKNLKLKVVYFIEYNLEEDQEERSFSINVLTPLGEVRILKNEFLNTTQKLFHKGHFIPFGEALLVSEKILDSSDKYLEQLNQKRKSLENQIQELKKDLSKIEKENLPSEDKGGRKTEIKEGIAGKTIELQDLVKSISELDVELMIISEEKDISSLEKEIKELKEANSKFEKVINTLKTKSTNLTVQEKRKLTLGKKGLQSNLEKISKKEAELSRKNSNIFSLKTPLEVKYSGDIKDLDFYLTRYLRDELINFLPKVVFWEHSKDFILESKTSFKELLEKERLADISRPLLNVFRIGLKIKNLEELKKEIKTIQEDEGERTRSQDTLNKNLNEHIDRVWKEYDQDVKISLEEHQIRIQFYDPDFIGKSYFNMDEKSQGAQTFLSFLLTIGAEAAHGVLKNTILLLDEPETHLHPSGVRFMLQELIKISERGNIVIYATHSIFMIDKNNYNRHIFLKKRDERTSINVSERKRIGYFMQEEVLFGALGFDPEKDLNTKKLFNFVFEGQGDVLLFEHFYTKVLSSGEVPFELKKSGFYQGGKCTNIQKYLIKKPIQLGTKWVFIIDSDETANKLKKFIESNYGPYLGIEIFLNQYNPDKPTELEDLLPDIFLKEIYKITCEGTGNIFNESEIEKIIIEDYCFPVYNKIITEKLKVKDSDIFKALWKSNLNVNIQEKLDSINSKEDFKDAFPKYFDWAMGVVEKIKSEVKGKSPSVQGVSVIVPANGSAKEILQ